MALDVNSSLATTLFTAPGRAKSSDQVGTTSSRPATLPGAKGAPESFSSYIGDKSANATGKVASKPATLPPRKLMPGQIADHQDTKVSAQQETEGATKTGSANSEKTAAEATRVGEGANRKASAEGEARVAEETTRESAEGRAEGPSAESNAASEAAESAGEQKEGGSSASGEQSQQEEGQTSSEAAPNTEASDGATAPVVGQPIVVATSVGAPAQGGVGTAASGDMVIGSATDAKPAPTAPTLPPNEAVQTTEGGEAAAGDVAAVTTAAPAEVGKKAPPPAPTLPTAAESRPDTTLQPGMTQQVEARKEAASGIAGLTQTGETSGIESAESKGTSVGTAADSLRPVTHEGPVLRGAIFSQVLEGFAGTHGLTRAHDVLASLDTSVAAQAQNNRAASEAARPTPLQMLPVEIGMQAVRGAREFQIRLDPAELGRVDVKLHINDKGEVNATMIVERPETLQMLRRDATTLAQAFEQAGLKQGENSLNFSLRGDGDQGQNQQQGGHGRGREADDPALNAQVAEIVSRRVMIPNSSLDLMV